MDSTDCKYTVYMHTAPNGKMYIGITCQSLVKRWGSGGRGYRECTCFMRAIDKHGWDRIEHEVIVQGVSEEAAKILEKELIAKYQTRNRMFGYNLTAGGDGMNGYHHPPEAKEKIRKANIGKLVSDGTRAKISAAGRGRVFSADARANMGAAHLGVPASEERKEKISAALIGNKNNLGNKRSNDTKQKQSDSLTGRVFSKESREKIQVAKAGKRSSFQGRKHTEESKAKIRDARNGGIIGIECVSLNGTVVGIYPTTTKAEEVTGIRSSSIRRACAGKSKSSGGFKWRYLREQAVKGTGT